MEDLLTLHYKTNVTEKCITSYYNRSANILFLIGLPLPNTSDAVALACYHKLGAIGPSALYNPLGIFTIEVSFFF